MYLPIIDVLRFISALNVMLFHYFGSSVTQVNLNLISYLIKYGNMGVQLFYIISGIVIYFSVKKTTKEYIASRFSRIYPSFFIACTITYITTVLFSESHLSISSYIKNLLLIAGTKSENLVDGSYWSLVIEVIFYSYIGLFVYLFKKEKIEIFYTGWLIITLLSYFFSVDNSVFGKLLLVRYSPYFIFGGIIGLCIQYWKTSSIKSKFRYVFVSLISMLSVIYISYIIQNRREPITNAFALYSKESLPLIISIFLIVPISVYFSFKIKNKFFIKTASILGGITYPLYLLHQKLGEIIIGHFSKYKEITYFSIFFTMFMIIISYYISTKEPKLRKYINNITLDILNYSENHLIKFKEKIINNKETL